MFSLKLAEPENAGCAGAPQNNTKFRVLIQKGSIETHIGVLIFSPSEGLPAFFLAKLISNQKRIDINIGNQIFAFNFVCQQNIHHRSFELNIGFYFLNNI